MSVRPSPGDWAGRGGGGAGGGGGGGRAQGGVRVCASDSADPSGGCLHPSGWGPAQPGRPRRLPLPSLTLPPRVPASTYPASPGRLAERAAPASCDCPELVPGARGEPGAEPRGAGARAGAQRERLPHARPSPSPSLCPAAATATAARAGTLTLLHSRDSRQIGFGPLFLVCSAQHRASKSKSPLPHLSSPRLLLSPVWVRPVSFFPWGGGRSEWAGGCSAGVGAPVGLGKCNSSSKPGVGTEGEARGGEGGPRVQRFKVWDSREPPCGSRGVGDRDPRRPPRPRRGRGRGLTCVVPRLPPARPLAIPSKASEISVLSACGNVVWRKVARRPRTPAPPPPGPPPPAPMPSPPRPPPPPSSDGARDRSPAGAKLGAASRGLWEETWGHWD